MNTRPSNAMPMVASNKKKAWCRRLAVDLTAAIVLITPALSARRLPPCGVCDRAEIAVILRNCLFLRHIRIVVKQTGRTEVRPARYGNQKSGDALHFGGRHLIPGQDDEARFAVLGQALIVVHGEATV